MDEKTMQMALEMTNMGDGTFHPGAMKVIDETYKILGSGGVQVLKDNTTDCVDIWDKYISAGKNVAVMLKRLL